jgi:probable HAF family extracellular repeat protein
MKRNVLTAMVLTAGVLAMVSSTSLATAYLVQDLGTLGGAWSRPQGINNLGQVVGQSMDASGNRVGFVWSSAGGIQSIGSLGGNDSIAYGINDSGTIVGGSLNASGYWHAFKGTAGSLTDLGTLTGGVYSNAYAINNAGQVAGTGDWYVSNPGRQYTPIRWDAAGVKTDLGTLGGVLGWGYAINTAGNVAGAATNSSNYTHGFRYTTSEADMGVLTSGLYSEMHGINDVGTVVGVADTSTGYTHAVYRTTSGSLTDMGLLSGSTGYFSEARDVNNSGVIVGRSEVSDGTFHGFMYTIGGSMIDLNTLPEVIASGKTVYDALGINDNGDIIVDFGAPGDTERAGLIRVNTGPVHTYLPADFNHDFKVSFADYLILEQNFGKSGMTNTTGDADGDGKCSFADYVLLEAEFGHTTTPEPASLILLACGGLALIRRR